MKTCLFRTVSFKLKQRKRLKCMYDYISSRTQLVSELLKTSIIKGSLFICN